MVIRQEKLMLYFMYYIYKYIDTSLKINFDLLSKKNFKIFIQMR